MVSGVPKPLSSCSQRSSSIRGPPRAVSIGDCGGYYCKTSWLPCCSSGPSLSMVWDTFLKAAPSLALIGIIMGCVPRRTFTKRSFISFGIHVCFSRAYLP
ncbi:hypothetical protein O9929_13070 [Vibrio lentus]|nr:hypothetical protein [Vibrio lentus]